MASVFICHASEDKDAFVRPLANALREQHLEVWFDEFSLKVGDSLREAIDRGLVRSDYAVVVISPHFFAKRWPQRELNGLVAREMAGQRGIILPVWHGVDRDAVLRHSPPLADTVAAASELGLASVIKSIMDVVRPERSPLVVARERLDELGISTPSVTDDYWLDTLALQEWHFRSPDCSRRWIFPLPFSLERTAYERGMNLASTVLQLDWCEEADRRGFCQLTHPDELHSFIRAQPGMIDTVRDHPALLALYAPQLTIPGFDNGLEDVFDAMLSLDRKDAYEFPGYGGGRDTVDGEEPLCGDLIAWRHPSLGNFTNSRLAYSFVHSHDMHYTRYYHTVFECLTWLLSDKSAWLPQHLADALRDGIRQQGLWFDNIYGRDNALAAAMLAKSRGKFAITKAVRGAIETLFRTALSIVRAKQDASVVAERFIELGFIEAWYAEQERMTRSRRRRRSRQ